MKKHILCLALTAALLLSWGCTARNSDIPGDTTPVSTPASTQDTTPAETPELTPAPTPAPTEPELPAVEQGSIDTAPGTVAFQLGAVRAYCGSTVASVLAEDLSVDGNLDALVMPMGYSDEIRLCVPDAQGKYEDYLFVVAVNPTPDPRPVRDCLIYSLSLNCQKGLGFSLGGGSFRTGEATRSDILSAWGTPAVCNEGKDYIELVYYRPFSMVQIILRKGVAEQVRAYHSAWLYPELAQTPMGDYMSGDAWLQLSRYLDVTKYLAGEKGEKRELPLSLQIDGKAIDMGMQTRLLPQPWKGLYQSARTILASRHYLYAQLPGHEGFTFVNPSWHSEIRNFSTTLVKGIHAFNPAYTGWGESMPKALGFTYNGFHHTGTIADVLAAMGQPYEVICESGTAWCFVWLHYESPKGDTLRIKADPISGQLLELRLDMKMYDVHPY